VPNPTYVRTWLKAPAADSTWIQSGADNG